jgi:hypothetical protein
MKPSILPLPLDHLLRSTTALVNRRAPCGADDGSGWTTRVAGRQEWLDKDEQNGTSTKFLNYLI